MAEYKGNYKWSYDPRNESLIVWEVDSAERAAMPQHFDMTGGDGYAYCSQGRLSIGEYFANGVIYNERPLHGDAREAQRTARILVEDEVNQPIDWNIE